VFIKKKMAKRLFLSFILLMFASCSGSKYVAKNDLTPEQRAEVKANGGFNPYYVSPDKMKVKMPKKPKHLR